MYKQVRMDINMQQPKISFEFFPPHTIEASFKLKDTVQILAPFSPRFVSVTYGAGGTTRQLTHQAVKALRGSTGLNVAAHLTCVNVSRKNTLQIADQFAKDGATEIVALRGDPPKGSSVFTPHRDGFQNSCELIEALAETEKFYIRVGAYPHKHPEATSSQQDILWLKQKFDAGAKEAITQFFFEADDFFRFRDSCVKAGIQAPIVPGILPIENWPSARKFAQKCGAKIPTWLNDAFTKAERDGRHDLLATAVCSELCSDLIEGGVDALHFYTLNRPELTRDICFSLGIFPAASLENVA